MKHLKRIFENTESKSIYRQSLDSADTGELNNIEDLSSQVRELNKKIDTLSEEFESKINKVNDELLSNIKSSVFMLQDNYEECIVMKQKTDYDKYPFGAIETIKCVRVLVRGSINNGLNEHNGEDIVDDLISFDNEVRQYVGDVKIEYILNGDIGGNIHPKKRRLDAIKHIEDTIQNKKRGLEYILIHIYPDSDWNKKHLL